MPFNWGGRGFRRFQGVGAMGETLTIKDDPTREASRPYTAGPLKSVYELLKKPPKE